MIWQLRNRKTASAEIRQDQQFEELNRGVSPFGVAPGIRTVRGDRRRHQPARVPELQLPGCQARQRRNLT
jgi:hypothetical protein